MSDMKRVEIGLGIGQVVSARLTDADLSALRSAVESGSGWHDLRTEDGTLTVNLATVIFIRVPDSSQGIGFSRG